MGDLETLEAIATFGFFSDDIEDGVDELSSLGVMTLGPVVTGTSLSEYEVVGSEKLTEWTCLLYTSPSPRDLSTSRMPSSA